MKALRAHPEWREIVALICGREYDTLITHQELAQVTGLRYGTARYYGQVNRARKPLLVEWSRELESVQREGYRLVKPNEFHDRGRGYVMRAGKWVRRGIRTVMAAPLHLLTDAENAKNADALTKFGALESLRKRVVHETKPAALTSPTVKADHPRLL